MMSGAKKRVPKRRFKEFLNAGDWEQYKLADILSRRKENRRIDSAYPRLAFAAGQGVIPLSERRTNNRDQLISDEKNKKYLVTYYNDIVYNPANLKYGAIDRNKYGQGVISPIYVTFTSNICSGFIEHIVKSHEFKEKALSFEEGTVTKRQAVNPDNLLKIDVVITPNSKEQEKISKLFELIDRFITLHQHKLYKLEATKKALLQEMFPEKGQDKPKRRFKGFTDAWEQRQLGECMNSFAYGLNAAAKNYDGMHKYIRITDIDDETHNFIQSNLTSPDIDFNMDVSDYKLNVGDIVFARTGASVGKTYLYNPNDGDLYYAGFLIRGKVKEDCDAGFIYQNTLTKEYDSFIRITSQRSGQPGVNSKEYATFRLNIPCKDEQEKISKILNCLDELFTLHQRKLDKLKNLKQAYLNEMFV